MVDFVRLRRGYGENIRRSPPWFWLTGRSMPALKLWHITSALVLFIKTKPAFAKATADEGGAGGSRTLVQTSSKNAFYMLSFLLVFEHEPEKSTPLMP